MLREYECFINAAKVKVAKTGTFQMTMSGNVCIKTFHTKHCGNAARGSPFSGRDDDQSVIDESTATNKLRLKKKAN